MEPLPGLACCLAAAAAAVCLDCCLQRPYVLLCCLDDVVLVRLQGLVAIRRHVSPVGIRHLQQHTGMHNTVSGHRTQDWGTSTGAFSQTVIGQNTTPVLKPLPSQMVAQDAPHHSWMHHICHNCTASLMPPDGPR